MLKKLFVIGFAVLALTVGSNCTKLFQIKTHGMMPMAMAATIEGQADCGSRQCFQPTFDCCSYSHERDAKITVAHGAGEQVKKITPHHFGQFHQLFQENLQQAQGRIVKNPPDRYFHSLTGTVVKRE